MLPAIPGAALLKSSRLWLGAAAALLTALSAQAQTTLYSFNQSQGTYTPITGGSVIATATANATSGASTLDDVNYQKASGTIPFSFVFNGSVYTYFTVNTNGYMTFQSGTQSINTPISNSTTSYYGAIAAFGTDLQGSTTPGQLAEIRYETLGSSPNRTFVLQWSNFKRYALSNAATNDVFNFQIRLQETTNAITYSYNLSTTNSTALTAQIGLRGASNADYVNRSTTSNWASTVAGSSNTASVTLSSAVQPASGLNFTYSQAACTSPPTAGSAVASPNFVCAGVTTTLSLSGSSSGTGQTYQWQQSTDNVNWNNVTGGTGATSSSYTTAPMTQALYYRAIVTCSGNSAPSNSALVAVNVPTYAGYPFTETFEASWLDACATKDAAGASWRTNPATGNNSWRRQNEGSTAGWTSTTSGIVTPSGSTGAADFHSYSASSGTQGSLDLYMNLPGTNPFLLSFDYLNTSNSTTNAGVEKLEVLLSTDGGATFPTTIATLNLATTWTRYNFNLGVVNSATTVIRFRATSDFGTTDIGLDNVAVGLAPTPLSGIKTINNQQPTAGNNYNNFTDAINALNLAGVGTGGVTFRVYAGQLFLEETPAITASGTSAKPITFIKYNGTVNPVIRPTGTSGTADAGIIISGGDYITFDGIDITTHTGSAVEYGYVIRNYDATNGALNNTIRNAKITLTRSNLSTVGVVQSSVAGTAGAANPTATTGVNQNNTYEGLTIENCYSGILLTSNSSTNYADNNNTITGCTIGGTSAGDIGGGTSAAFGIKATYQNSVSIKGNEIRNVAAAAQVDGIWLDKGYAAGSTFCEISGNVIHDLMNSGTTSTSFVTGIRSDLFTTVGGHTARLFNNFIYGLTSAYTGMETATRTIKGIYLQSNGGNGGTHQVHFNNVRIDGSSSPNVSSTALEIATTSSVYNVRNNILTNFTGSQAGLAKHYTWVTTASASIGASGSVSNNNDLYIANTTNGYIGLSWAGGTPTDRATLANWQSVAGNDANSISTNPNFFSVTDLHVSAPALNGAADMSGITWVAVDIDNDTRTSPHDIGADDFALASLDMGVASLGLPPVKSCYNNAEPVTVLIRNFSSDPIDFSVNNVLVTVRVTTSFGTTQTLSYTLTNNSLNGGAPLASNGTLNIPIGTINMTVSGDYTFNAVTTILTGGSDGNTNNDDLSPAAIRTVNPLLAGTAYSGATDFCVSGSTSLTLAGYSGGSIQWKKSTTGAAGSYSNITSASSATYNTPTLTQTTYYMAEVSCNSSVATSNVVQVNVNNPTITSTNSGVTRCGTGQVTLTAAGSGTIKWYETATGGTEVATGSSFTTTVTGSKTYYVAASSATGGTETAGKTSTTGADGSYNQGNTGLVFDAAAAFTLQSVQIFPTSSGNLVIELRDNAGTLLNSTASIPVTTTTATTPVTVQLNFPITAGTGYRLVMGSTNVPMLRDFSGATYPYTSPSGNLSITGGLLNSSTSSTYYFFYNWMVSTECIMATRTQVSVNVTTPPALTVTPSNPAVCGGVPVNMTASGSGYTSYAWSPVTGLSAANGATVTASPSATTTYTVTATSSSCGNTATAIVQVLPTPATPVITASGPTSFCQGSNVTLSVTPPASQVTVGTGALVNSTSGYTSGAYPTPYGNTYWGSKQQMLITAADLTAAGLSAGSPINSLAFDVATVGGTTVFQGFTIKIGTTALSNLPDFQSGLTTVYGPVNYSITTGWNTHTFSTPYTWDGFSNLLVETCFNNSGYTSNGNAAVRYSSTSYQSTLVYRADNSTVCAYTGTPTYTYSGRPNMRFGVTVPTYTWSPAAGLNTTNGASVVASPSSPTVYTVVASTGTTCTSSATQSVSVYAPPATPTVTSASICGPGSVTLNASGSGNGVFKWYSAATGGTLLYTGPSYTTTVSGNVNFYVEKNDNGCASARATASVTVAPAATVSATASNSSTCQSQPVVLSASSSNSNYTYSWSGPNLVSTSGASVTARPATLGQASYTVTATDAAAACQNTATVVVAVTSKPYISAGDDQLVPQGSTTTLMASTANTAALKISEVAQSATSQGGNQSFPGYMNVASGNLDEFIEISNIGNVGLMVGGYTVQTWFTSPSTADRTYTIPAGTIIPPSSVLVIHIGSGTDAVTNRFFNTGGTSNAYAPDAAVGYVVRSGSTIIDAVALNGYSFPAASGVTASDWAGGTLNTTGKAGVQRNTNADDNTSGNWTVSSTPTPRLTIGTYNSGIASVNLGTIVWTTPTGTLSGASITTPPVTAATAYVVTFNAGGCSSDDTVLVDVCRPGVAVAADSIICTGNTTISLTGTSGSSVKWQFYSGTAWVDAPGVNTDPTYTTPFLTKTSQYRARTSCTGSVVSVSNVVTIYVRPTATLPLTKVTFTGFTGNNLSTVFPQWSEGVGRNNINGVSSAWTVPSSIQEAYFGNNRTARVNLAGNTRNEWIAGPTFAATDSTKLYFKAAITTPDDVQQARMGQDDALTVMISANCGITWDSIFSLTQSDSLRNRLTTFTVDLSAYSGQNIVVAFRATEGDVNNPEEYDLHLDDIMILTPIINVLPVADVCTSSEIVLAQGKGEWRDIVINGELIGAINDNGNDLGIVEFNYQYNNSDQNGLDQDGKGQAMLDRYFHVIADNEEFTGSFIKMRFYVKDSEIRALAADPRGGFSSADPRVAVHQLAVTQYSGANENCDVLDNNYEDISTDVRFYEASQVMPRRYSEGYYLEVNVYDHLSEFGISGPILPLPVKMLSYTAKRDQQDAVLEWSTATETDNKGFELEVSADGEHFSHLASVASHATNSQRVQRYTYTDKTAGKSGVRYYRLKQVDLDGTITTVGTRAVRFDELSTSLSVMPNPFVDQFRVELDAAEEQDAQLTLTDVLGRTVATKTVHLLKGNNTVVYHLGSEAKGVYLLSAQIGTQQLHARLIKQ